jgi:hypothetical protein
LTNVKPLSNTLPLLGRNMMMVSGLCDCTYYKDLPGNYKASYQPRIP